MPVMGAAKFERFFRAAASLDVDKNDLRRHSEFIGERIYDLLVVGRATAKANLRDIIEPFDLPVSKGLQESIHDFRELDEDIELKPIMEQLAVWPPLDVALSERTQDRLPDIVGGLSVALARTFKIIDPSLKNPQTREWGQVFRIFELLL